MLAPDSHLLGTPSVGTAGSDLLASSESFQRLAFPYSLPSRSPPSRAEVETARPQVHVALLPLLQIPKVSPNLKVLLHLQVFSRRQPRRHAVLPNVPWSTRTLVSWLCTPSYDGTLDEPICTPCNLASRSTSHHELFALAKMVLNLKDFEAKNKIVKCTLAHVIIALFTRQSSHCSDLYDTTRSSDQVCV